MLRGRSGTPSLRFRSPITWTAGSWHGHVSELAPDLLLLEGVLLPTNPPSELLAVELRLDDGRVFPVEGYLKSGPRPGTLSLRLDGAASKTSIRDLLGQLRKVQHIEICAREDVEASDRFTGFDRISLMPEALPELDAADIDTRTLFLGRVFPSPLYITGMTGGVELGAMINRRLAAAAHALGLPMGVGSQRIACDNPAYSSIFTVKKEYPGLFLVGNLGFAQLREAHGVELCQAAVDMIEADALAIHLNVLQECVQVEGDRAFRGALARLETLCAKLAVPVIVKEVGSGLSPATVRRLLDAGVAAVDIAGSGGTSWGYIEGLRSSSAETMSIAQTFRDWGIPTAYSLAAVRRGYSSLPLIASGGIRDGLMVAKACGLGANLVGVGLPLMRAALQSEEAVLELLSTYLRGLRLAMLASGSANLSALASKVCLGRPWEAEFTAGLAARGLAGD